MSDDLQLPQVPEAKPEDTEDVSWALSTAEAMWARGDHADGIKWVRRAAEAASEADNDARALELAKAAADLAGLLARRSRASLGDEDIEAISELVPISEGMPVAEAAAPAPRPGRPAPPKPAPGGGSPPAKGLGGGAPASIRPPAPLPSRTSQPPPRNKPASMRPGARGVDRAADKKKNRRSRENLDDAAAAAKAFEEKTIPAELDAAPGAAAVGEPFDTTETAAVVLPQPKRIGANDPTFVGHVSDIVPAPKGDAKAMKTAAEWDLAATQNLTGDELPFLGNEGDRKTAVGGPPPNFKSTMQSFAKGGAPAAPVAKGGLGAPLSPAARGGSANPPAAGGTNPPATVAGASPFAGPSAGASAAAVGPLTPQSPAGARASSVDQHDPGIQTTQAVRVVVWRDASGVHVAPAGTVVSAITVDAVLVALEPHADLTAWLSEKSR